MKHATTISIPTTDRVREIIREVRDVRVDGAVFTRRGRPDYVAISEEAVRSKQEPAQGVEITSMGNWLVYRLLHEAQPSGARYWGANLDAIGFGSASRSVYYNKPGPCAEVPETMRQKILDVFAVGDERLREDLNQVLAEPPLKLKVGLAATYLTKEVRNEIVREGRPVISPAEVKRIAALRAQFSSLLDTNMETVGLSNAKLATLLGEVGIRVHRTSIRQYRENVAMPELGNTEAIGRVFEDCYRARHSESPMPPGFSEMMRLREEIARRQGKMTR